MHDRTIGGVHTSYFDALNPIPRFWANKAHSIIYNWNKDGSAKIAGAEATSAIVTPSEIILYNGGREIFRKVN